MAELLSHVLLAYALFTVAGWGLDWLDRRWVAVGMIGSLVPDVTRIGLFVSDVWVEETLGVAFRIDAVHTLGGVLLLCGVGATLFARESRRAFGVLLAGALSHLLVDAVKAWADGAAGAWLYPLTWWRHPTPSLYVSADWWVAVLSAGLAVGVLLCDRYVVRQ